MALRSLELRKAIDDKKRSLAQLEKTAESFAVREAELTKRVSECSDEERAAVETEVDAFNQERAAADEEMSTMRESIAEMEKELEEAEEAEPSKDPEPIEEKIERKEEKNMITRDSLEYNVAFVRGIKTGNYDECRSLLTTGVSGGVIPIPTQLETEIQTAWEQAKVLGLCKQSSFAGNVKVGFELSADGASIHVEGAAAPSEETITLGTVEVKNQMIKKWITVSDEALEGTTVDTAAYLYKEIAQKIAEKAEAIAIAAIIAQPATADSTHPGVAVKAMNPDKATILEAVSLLASSAQNLHIVMNRQTYPAFVDIALNANYAIDVFDGLKDRIIFSDAVKAYSACTAGQTNANGTYAIVGDFSAVQINKPAGNDVKITVDPYSLAEKDLVKLVGRMYAGIEVVSPKKLVKICKVTAG